MSLEQAERALDLAAEALKVTCFDAALNLHMSANRMWRRSITGQTMTRELAARADAFTIKSLNVREDIRLAVSSFGRASA